jgi:DNA-binding response OmpR family regulator
MALILIVEDYPSLQRMYSMALADAGHKILVAGDGEEAQAIAGSQRPDLILLDLLLPKVDGIEFLESYNPRNHPETKIIVFSNMDTPDLSKKVAGLGVDQYLIKSDFTPKEIVSIVNKTLQTVTKDS